MRALIAPAVGFRLVNGREFLDFAAGSGIRR